MKVIRKRLYAGEGLSSDTRWDDTCECVQMWDGTEWRENLEADPRYGVMWLAPPRTGGDPRCDAAQNMTKLIEDIINQFFLFATTVEVINAILSVLLVFVPGISIVAAVIIAFANAIFAIGVAAVLFAFTEDVYDTITCIFYGNIGEDGTITQAQLDAVQAEITTEYPGVVSGVTSLIFALTGINGVANAGSQGDETGDCEDCPVVWCKEWTGGEISSDWAQLDGSQGSLSTSLDITFATADVTLIEFEYTWNEVGGAGTAASAIFAGSNFGLPRLQLVNGLGVGAVTQWGDDVRTMTGCSVGVNGNTGSGCIVTISRIKMTGINESPFGEDDCEP